MTDTLSNETLPLVENIECSVVPLDTLSLDDLALDCLGMNPGEWATVASGQDISSAPVADDIIDNYMKKFDVVMDLTAHSDALACDVARPPDSSIGDHRLAAVAAFVANQHKLNAAFESLLIDMNNLIK